MSGRQRLSIFAIIGVVLAGVIGISVFYRRETEPILARIFVGGIALGPTRGSYAVLRSQKELGEFLQEHSLDRITTNSAWQAVGSSAYVVAVEGRDVADARKLNANLNLVTLSPLRSNGVFIVVIAGEPTLAVKMR